MEQPRVAEQRTLCRGRRFRLDSVVLDMGGGRRVVRDLLVHPGAVVLLPILPGERVVLLRQYRVGPRKWIYELPAGTIEEGESPWETAERELVEETGYRAGRLELLFTMYPSPGVSTEKMYMFLAEDLEYVGARPEEDEALEVTVVGLDEALEMVRRGDIVDGKTIALLLYYKAFVRRG